MFPTEDNVEEVDDSGFKCMGSCWVLFVCGVIVVVGDVSCVSSCVTACGVVGC